MGRNSVFHAAAWILILMKVAQWMVSTLDVQGQTGFVWSKLKDSLAWDVKQNRK